MLVSHYAEPVERRMAAPAVLRIGPSANAEPVLELDRGDSFSLLEESLGWAWGYGGSERRVGYVPADALMKD